MEAQQVKRRSYKTYLLVFLSISRLVGRSCNSFSLLAELPISIVKCKLTDSWSELLSTFFLISLPLSLENWRFFIFVVPKFLPRLHLRFLDFHCQNYSLCLVYLLRSFNFSSGLKEFSWLFKSSLSSVDFSEEYMLFFISISTLVLF